MGAPIPAPLRDAIVRAYAEGAGSYDEVAALLGVGRATVNRVLRLKRETGSVAPRPRGGGNLSPIHGRLADLLVAVVTRMPDATVAELTNELISRADISTSRSSVLRALGRLGYSRKKSPSWQRSATRPSTASAVARSARS
jgi:transposase